ncbi:MAG: hypothetical protein ACOVQ4_07080 [Flectobacillus sp.]|uniref:hypothetical protein n=1 Tax=Flectobacillus sp. TaxID=50419 RepID=UPI003B99BBF9
MKKLYLVLTLLVGALTLQSCDETLSPNADTIAARKLFNERIKLLVDKTWKFYLYVTINPDGSQVTNYSVKDGIGLTSDYSKFTYVFKSDGTFVLSSANSSLSGKWELSADGKAISTQLGIGAPIIYSIETLTNDELELESSSSKLKLII